MDDDTEIMSRYLQRGATMLGEHCDDCGNPLFRVQGEEVCVVCRTREHAEAEAEERRSGGDASGERGGDAAAPADERSGGAPEGRGSDDASSALTGSDRAPVDEVRRNVLAVARRVSREAREERELGRLDDQLAVLERCAEVLDELE